MTQLMTMMAANSIIALWYIRFAATPQDRDFTPYAYPAFFRTRWLDDGHCDIKPPLIHWLYKLVMPRNKIFGIGERVRVLPMFGAMVACVALSVINPFGAVLLAVMLASPTLWTHMANTEWLTTAILAMAALAGAKGSYAVSALFIGVLPWANQKNVFIVLPAAWACGLGGNIDGLVLAALVAPSVAILGYIITTKRIIEAYVWLIAVPAAFGKTRTIKKNILSASTLLVPCLTLLAPIVAGCDLTNKWMLVAAVMLAAMVWSKQIVPHHFIALSFPLAISARPSVATILGLALVWAVRDGICWWKPQLVYRFTFAGGGGNYGDMMADCKKIEKMIMENTSEDEVIWVNGMENQIYLNTHRKAWRVEIPELPGLPEGEAPRYIVHCPYSAKQFDYSNYRPAFVSTSGAHTLMERN
jgi:hypothetical protein